MNSNLKNDTTLLFLGDYCLRENDDPTLGPDAKILFARADTICLNFEAPITKDSMQAAHKTGPALSQPIEVIEHCRKLGITHCTLANNHIMDYGEEGLRETLLQLKGITTLGAGFSFNEIYQPVWLEKDDKQIALFSFAEAQFGVWQEESKNNSGFAWIDHPKSRAAIQDARLKADWIIVQVHAGLEMVDLPLPEWRSRYRELVDLGADLVIGHHPHVMQGSECYKDKMIHYSLGNFFMGAMLKDQSNGAALEVTISESEIQSNLIPLKTNPLMIELDHSDSSRQAYNKLCDKLVDSSAYYPEIQEICDAFWKEIYSDYYAFALVGLGTKPSIVVIKKFIYQVGRYLFRKKASTDVNELMLLHNIRIESHRWVVERALGKNISEKP